MLAGAFLMPGCPPMTGGGGGGNVNMNDNMSGNTNDNMNDNTDGGSPRWQAVLDIPDAALLAVAGISATDVYAVGADPDDGTGSMFLHYDGATWTRMASQTTDTLWWINPVPIDGKFYLSGDNGQIVRFDPATGDLTPPHDTPDAALRVFGIWGAAADDVWAVCSDESLSGNGGAIWHYDGNTENTWTDVDLSAINPEGIPGLIKVWGRSANEIYAVGSLRTVLVYDGTAWAAADVQSSAPATRTLFSVYGNSTTVATCGGFQDAVILQLEGGSFVDATFAQPITPQMNGIFITEDGQGVTIGIELSVAFLEDGQWDVQSTGLENFALNYHGPWIDPDGGIWATGGNINGDPMNNGVLHYYGTATVTPGAF